jgi:hypothetical protein
MKPEDDRELRLLCGLLGFVCAIALLAGLCIGLAS